MRLKKGSLVVIEGLDSTGKSTLAESLAKHVHGITVVHSPSGGGPVGEEIYELTERNKTMLGATRQFLHLAAHCEIYEHTIFPALETSAVVMDRNWCSTYAYGMAGGVAERIHPDDWYDLVKTPALDYVPDLIVLCLEPHVEDEHNTQQLEEAYLGLAHRLDADSTIKHVRRMPRGTPKYQLIALMQMCQDAGLTRSR